MIPLSFSAMSDGQCPFRFKVLRIDKSYKEPVTDILKIGSAVAEVLAAYREHAYEDGVASDLSFLDGAHLLYPEGIKCRIGELLESFGSTPFAVVPLDAEWVHVESQPLGNADKFGGFAFNKDLLYIGCNKAAWLHRDVAFRLKTDFCYYRDGALHIIDDKTGWGDGDEQQLAIYAFLVKTAFQQLPINGSKPLSTIVCTFNNIAKRTTTSLEFSPDDVEPMRQVLLDAINEINERTEWPAVACPKCDWCTVPGCLIREQTATALVSAEGSPIVEIPTEIFLQTEAEKALLFVIFAEALTERVKGMLRAWVDKNGSLEMAGKVARFQEKETVKPKNLQQLAAALVQLGAPKELVWSNLSLTKAALDKIIKKAKLEDKRPWIDPHLEKSTSRSFGIVADKTF